MRLDEIRNLVRLLEESEISEIEVSRWWGRIRLAKDRRGQASANGDASRGDVAVVLPEPALPPVPPPELPVEAAVVDERRHQEITSPMVGTFYRAPAPDADHYVEIGQQIEVGQTVCIIEAMKLMNEIESDVRGRLVEILVENTQAVEYGQPLFRVDID